MSTTVIVARATDDVFADATITSTVAPSSTYSLATLNTQVPAARVRFGSGTVTITWTLGSAARGDIFVLPVSNLDAGTGVATLTNGAGLSVGLTVPAMQANGIPRTLVVDLALAQPTALTRTSTVWNLVVSGNTANLILGGAAFLFTPKRTLDAIQWGIGYRKTQHVRETMNQYGGRYRVNFRTNTRELDCVARVEAGDLDDLENWYDANAGLTDPGLLWVQRDELDAYIGTWQEVFEARQVGQTFQYDVSMQFSELSKGKPV